MSAVETEETEPDEEEVSVPLYLTSCLWTFAAACLSKFAFPLQQYNLSVHITCFPLRDLFLSHNRNLKDPDICQKSSVNNLKT